MPAANISVVMSFVSTLKQLKKRRDKTSPSFLLFTCGTVVAVVAAHPSLLPVLCQTSGVVMAVWQQSAIEACVVHPVEYPPTQPGGLTLTWVRWMVHSK